MKKSEQRPQKRLYSLQDTALYLGRSLNSIRQMLWDGKLPHIRDGKRIFIDVRDLELWIERNKQTLTY